MADAWTILTNNSGLSSGDAWGHLNAQESGSVIYLDRYVAKKSLTFGALPAKITFSAGAKNLSFSASVVPLTFGFTDGGFDFKRSSGQSNKTFTFTKVIS